ncbi:MAG TPA: DUF59 domain-containing protein [Granulicella sp.]
MLTEDHIRTALRDCFDPAIPCNLVDLGVVESVMVAADPDAPGAGIPGVPQRHRVFVALTPTTLDEAATAQIAAQIANRLAGLEEVERTDVSILHEPAWTPQRITPAGRRTLGLDGNPTLVQIR